MGPVGACATIENCGGACDDSVGVDVRARTILVGRAGTRRFVDGIVSISLVHTLPLGTRQYVSECGVRYVLSMYQTVWNDKDKGYV